MVRTLQNLRLLVHNYPDLLRISAKLTHHAAERIAKLFDSHYSKTLASLLNDHA